MRSFQWSRWCVSAVIGLGLIGVGAYPATANIVRNPLYDLKHEDLCVAKPVPKNNGLTDTTTPLNGQTDRYQSDRIPDNITVFDADPGNADYKGDHYWQVDRFHIITALRKRYTPTLNDLELEKKNGASLSQLIAQAVAPCVDITDGDSKKRPPYEHHLCTPKDIHKADEVRFDGNKGALKMRRALLRLFDVTETGTSRSFGVVRSLVPKDELLPEEARGNHKPIYNKDEYRPKVKAALDDKVLRMFILGVDKDEAGNPPTIQVDGELQKVTETFPFTVLCRPAEDVEPNAPKPKPPIIIDSRDKTTNQVSMDGERSDEKYPFESGMAERRLVAAAGDFLEGIKRKHKFEDDTIGDITRTHTNRISLLKDPKQFGKTGKEAEKAKFGFAQEFEGDANGLSINATLGIAHDYVWQDKGGALDNDPKKKLTVTPFLSIQQAPQSNAIFVPDSEEDTDLEPDTGNETIAYAVISSGVRSDLEFRSRVINDITNSPKGCRDVDFIGRRCPGFRVGAMAEAFTDNYEVQLGYRIGADISPPRIWNIPGYRHRQSLDINPGLYDASGPGSLPRSPRFQVGGLARGWSLEWDFNVAGEKLEYFSGRSPLDFKNPINNSQVDSSIFDTFLWGTRFEVELLKAQSFGNIFGDSILKLGVAHSFRRGYDRPEDPDSSATFRKVAELLEITAGIKHPDYDNIDFEFSYKLGESFTDLSKIDTLSLGVGMKY